MSFCKATRTYFKANEGIEAINQYGEKRLYSPFASFFYCIECDTRMVTEKRIIEYTTQYKIKNPIEVEKDEREYRIRKAKELRELNLIRKEARKYINTLVYIGEINIQNKRSMATALKTTDFICRQEEIISKISVLKSYESIKNVIRLFDKDFSTYVKRLKRESQINYFTPSDRRVDSAGKGVCKEHEDLYGKCDFCGEWTNIDKLNDIEEVYDGHETVCNTCLEKVYTFCDCCEKYINTDNHSYEVIDGKTYCIDCRDQNFYRCEECGNWVYNDNICCTSDNHNFCDDCWNNVVTECSECGEYFRITDMDYDEDEDTYTCYRCDDRSRDTIHCYSYKPNPKKHGNPKEVELIGMEIEVDGNKNKAKYFLENFGDTTENDIYLKQDGSVHGFEIVTQPMSRKYFYREFVPKLKKGMAYLRKQGFKGHNKAGIHIHVSTEAINEDMLKKMMILMYSHQKKTYETWLKITQRKDDQMRQWSSMNPRSLFGGNKKNVAQMIDNNKSSGRRKKPDLSPDRYTAINCRNTNTIEFRIFNSNIRTERIIKNAQVIFALIDFTKTDRMPTMSNYLRFIEKNREVYRELYDFLIEKEIIQEEKSENIMDFKKLQNISEINSEDDERNIIQCA